MTKTELERAYQSLLNSHDNLTVGLVEIRKFIDINLEVFRNGLADEEDERTAGIKEVLMTLGKLWNARFNKMKIDLPYEFGGKIIQFPKKEKGE